MTCLLGECISKTRHAEALALLREAKNAVSVRMKQDDKQGWDLLERISDFLGDK